MAMVCRPDEQKRFTVTPEVVIGRPPSRPAWRAMLPPPWATLPSPTSSVSAAPGPALATACFTAGAAVEGGGVMLNPPGADCGRPVGAYETMPASRILNDPPENRPARAAPPRRSGRAQPLHPGTEMA